MALTVMQRLWTTKTGGLIRRIPQLPRNLLERKALERRIGLGDFFINGMDNHPVLVINTELEAVSLFGPWDYAITGLSLVNGQEVIGNSARHSGLRAISFEQAVQHLIVAFWDKGTGEAVWNEAVRHVTETLAAQTLHQDYLQRVHSGKTRRNA